MQYIGSLEAAEKHISAEICKKNLHTSVKILQICMDLQDQCNDLCRTLQTKSCRSAQIRKDRKPVFSVLVDFTKNLKSNLKLKTWKWLKRFFEITYKQRCIRGKLLPSIFPLLPNTKMAPIYTLIIEIIRYFTKD